MSFATLAFKFRQLNTMPTFSFAFSCIDIETSTSLSLFLERVKLYAKSFEVSCYIVAVFISITWLWWGRWRSASVAKLINMALPRYQHLANISFDNGYEQVRELIYRKTIFCRIKNRVEKQSTICNETFHFVLWYFLISFYIYRSFFNYFKKT